MAKTEEQVKTKKAKSEIGKKTGAMTLFEAKNKAKELTLKTREKKVYVVVSIATGDCAISYNPNVPEHETHHVYKNGSEIALETKDITPITKTPKGVKEEKNQEQEVESKNNLKTKTMKKENVKPAKKEVAKKAAKSNNRTAVKGKKKTLTVKAIISLLKSGNVVINAANNKTMKLAKLQAKANLDAEREVYVTSSK